MKFVLKMMTLATLSFGSIAGAAVCEHVPGVAIVYPNYSLYREDPISYHNDKTETFGNKLRTLAERTGVWSQAIGESVDMQSCFEQAVRMNRLLTGSRDLSAMDLILEHVLPFSNNAKAVTFMYWTFIDNEGNLTAGMVNRATESVLSTVESGDQRFHADGSPLIRK